MATARRPQLARIGLIAGTVAVLLLILWLFVRTSPVAVDLGEVDSGDIEITVGDDGIASAHEVYEVASPVAGRLLRIDPEVGDPVVANQTVLARLVPSDPGFLDQRSRSVAQANLEVARSRLELEQGNLQRAEAGLRLARREFERVETIAQRGFASSSTLDRARAARDEAAAAASSARAAVAAARDNVAAARAQLSAPLARDESGMVLVRAPVSGSVLQLFQESEAVVRAGERLVAVGDPKGDLEVIIDLLSTDAVRVQPDARVYIEEWGGSRPLLGRVRRVEPFGFLKISALGVEEQRVNVRIDFVGDPASWSRLGHGYRVEARIVTAAAHNVLRIPSSALFREGKDWAAFVLNDGRARLRRLEIGVMNERFAEVRRGLSKGERVVLFPSEAVRDGTKLTVRPR